MADACAQEGQEWPLWTREDVEHGTPSRKDGIPSAKEAQCRRTAGIFLAEAGKNLKIPQLTIATATVFYNRFFVVQSLKHHDHMIIASSALFLACKVEETPRNLIDVIKVTYTLQFRNNPDKLKLLSNKEVFHSRMDAVLFGERVLLHVLAFDLDIEHPYIYLVQGRKKLPVGFPETEGLKLLQCAWNIVNDSMKISTLSLEHTPRDIGAAAFLLACKWTNLLPRLGSDGGAGFFRQIFRVSMTHIEDLSRAMLELYAGGEEQGKEGVGMMQLQEKGTEEADYRVRGDALGTGGFDQDQKAAIKDPLDLDHLEDGELPA